jgi:hypothetical protein
MTTYDTYPAHTPCSFAALLQQFCDKPRPAGLMARADASAVIAVEIFVKEHQVSPVRIALERLGAAVHRASTVGSTEEEVGETTRQLRGHVP